MRNKRFLSFVTAVAISASVVSGMVLNAEAKSTVYTWDFTDTSYFGEEIAMGSDIISDQNETDAILSNPGARFSVADGKATDDSGNSVRVAKTEAQVTNAVSIKVPAGDSAELSIELTAGSSNRELSLKAEGSDAKVLTAVDYTKNVLKEYTASLDCGTTYYLDTTEYKAYIGKVTLTVKTDGEDDPQPTEKATEKATEAATEKATEAASAAPAPEGLTGLTSDISLNFNDESNKTFSENTVICGGYMRVYATSDKTVNVDASKKTIGGTAYTTRMKMVGAGTADGENSVRALEVYPSVNGTIQVDFAHASSSGDPRDIAVTQNGSTKTQSVDSNSTASIIVNVTAGASVYIYGMANINIYGVKFTAGGEAPTAAPATEKPTMPPGPSELTPITEDAAFNFNDYNNLTFSTNTVVCGGYVKIYAASGSTVNVDNSNKTIDGTKYTTRLKMNGAGKVNGESSTRVIGVMPGVNGQIQVDFAHASGSGDARQLALDQGGSTETQSVDGGATASLIATVKAGEMVYIYGLAGVNLYGIRFTALGELPTVDPNATPTPAPTPTPSPTPEPDLMKMDYKMLFTF
ncbi:MAG: hypothetical protein J1G06_08785, partial [Oscillospiraceae bacterium]|nr:hypothetical protein [Oscillospiraceae bacterium]